MSQEAIREALTLARQALWLSQPNPRVGCVLVNSDDHEIGRGYTRQAGGPHAEIVAIDDARHRGHSLQGATAYVTLEPCSHHGRTGPCCDALIASGITKVVASLADPNPLVAGRGFERLRAAGIEVVVGPGADEARELNIGFFSRMIRKRPWVRMKIAASLDGTTALTNGQSQWITSAPARADGHAWRARASAVMTGIGTVLHDNPRLDVRLVDTLRQPQRIIVDSLLQTPPDATILLGDDPVWIYAAEQNPIRQDMLKLRGAQVTYLPNANSKVNLADMMSDLARREVNELHVEAGSKLNASLIQSGLVDEFLIYLAPKLLGTGLGMTSLGPLERLADGVELEFREVQMMGPDLRVVARLRGQDRF